MSGSDGDLRKFIGSAHPGRHLYWGVVSSAEADDATVENFDRLTAVEARGTVLYYKLARWETKALGGRIVGAFPLGFIFRWH